MLRRFSDFAGLLALVAVLLAAWALTPSWHPAPVRTALRAGFDTGVRAIPLLAAVDGAGVTPMQGWQRIRGVPERRSPLAERTATRVALRDLRERGVRSMAFFTAAGYPWASGVRQLTGAKGTVPLDLREAYERGRWLGRRYGAFVDAWEVDNEPDLVYVRDNPENYAAYLKAMFWGLKRGGAQRASSRWTEDGGRWTVDGGRKPEGDGRWTERGEGAASPPGGDSDGAAAPSPRRNFPRAPRDEPSLGNRTESPASGFRSSRNRTSASDPWPLALGTWNFPRAPRVVMAPMALPPGPYFEALLDNDLLSYTDGFNFHYYGFEEDFPGVYAQHRAAVEERSARAVARASNKDQGASNREDGGRQTAEAGTQAYSPLSRRKSLPIVISEWGNGLLSESAAASVAGRVRQWEYFRSMAGHMRALRIEAPMAFYLRPYLEDGAREFGLTMRAEARADARASDRSQVSALSSQAPSSTAHRPPSVHPPSTVHRFSAGGLTFTPQDFGCDEPEPWMADIGRPIGGAEASPALAWLLNQQPLPEPEAWDITVPEPSPVVLDFVAGEGLRQSKTMRGHQLTMRGGARSTGRGTVWVYNFAARPVTGVVRLEGHGGAVVEQRLTLKPGERRDVPVEFAVTTERFHGVQWRAHFEADDERVPAARLASWIYPATGQFAQKVLADLRHSAPAALQNAARIDARPLARGEAPLFPQGRWRVTKGVTVEERGDTWRFTVTEFPDEVMRPAMAELPLPDGFRFPGYSMILAHVRLAPRRAEEVRAHPEPRGEPENSALDREVFGVYFRTAQGGLYVTTMNFAATTEGLNFGQVADNFTPFFYGRMHLPWRFLENEPAALALVFRPRLLPATYEVRGARIVELVTRD